MSTTTDTTPGADMSGPAGGQPAPKDPYIRGTDETVLLDLRELRAQEAADKAAREASAQGASAPEAPESPESPEIAETPATPGAELERYHGSHRRDAVLYADGGTAIPLDRVREVCHDLRQPVAAILMLASAAEMRPDVPERVRDVLQEIMSQTEEISATVRQFLDDAKQGVDGLGEPVPCNVAGLAAESVERWRATFDGDLALAAAEDPLHVTVDPVLFKRALGNVLSNGTRAAGESGRVQVTVRRFETAEGERAVIEVDDSGPGFGNIPAGHGLGLAVVRRTIEAAGGAVEFAEGPLGGALVRLVLPVTPIRPLSADDELTKTFHGEISLTQLAAQLAAGGAHPALADFDDDLFDEDFDDDFEDEFDEEETSPRSRESAEHTDRRPRLPTSSAPGRSRWRSPERRNSWRSAGPRRRGTLSRPGHRNPRRLWRRNPPRSPVRTTAATSACRSSRAFRPPRSPQPTDRGFFGESAQKAPDLSASGYFGLPLKADDTAPTEPPPAPHTRLYGPPTDITAHPLPAGLRSAQHDAAPTPQAPSEITAAAHPVRSAAVTPQASIETAAAQAAPTPFAAPVPAAPAAPQTLAEALAESAAAGKAFTAPVPAISAAPGTPPAAAAQPFGPPAEVFSATPTAPAAQQAPPTGQPSAAPVWDDAAAQPFDRPASVFSATPAAPAAQQAPTASEPSAEAVAAQPFDRPASIFSATPAAAAQQAPTASEPPAEAAAAQPFGPPASVFSATPAAAAQQAPTASEPSAEAAAAQPFGPPASAFSATPAPAAQQAPTADQPSAPASFFSYAPVTPHAPAEAAPATPAAAPQTPTADQPFAAPVPAEAAPVAQPAAAPAVPQPSDEAVADPEAEAIPAPSFEPGDTQPLHIIPTGQDDTALASIQLPSQANLTHPPRIPASALQPVASVQLSLLPGGAF